MLPFPKSLWGCAISVGIFSLCLLTVARCQVIPIEIMANPVDCAKDDPVEITVFGSREFDVTHLNMVNEGDLTLNGVYCQGLIIHRVNSDKLMDAKILFPSKGAQTLCELSRIVDGVGNEGEGTVFASLTGKLTDKVYFEGGEEVIVTNRLVGESPEQVSIGSRDRPIAVEVMVKPQESLTKWGGVRKDQGAIHCDAEDLKVRVAILGTPFLDVTMGLEQGHALSFFGAKCIPSEALVLDFNGDGVNDLVCEYYVKDTHGLCDVMSPPTRTKVVAKLADGRYILGIDFIRVRLGQDMLEKIAEETTKRLEEKRPQEKEAFTTDDGVPAGGR